MTNRVKKPETSSPKRGITEVSLSSYVSTASAVVRAAAAIVAAAALESTQDATTVTPRPTTDADVAAETAYCAASAGTIAAGTAVTGNAYNASVAANCIDVASLALKPVAEEVLQLPMQSTSARTAAALPLPMKKAAVAVVVAAEMIHKQLLGKIVSDAATAAAILFQAASVISTAAAVIAATAVKTTTAELPPIAKAAIDAAAYAVIAAAAAVVAVSATPTSTTRSILTRGPGIAEAVVMLLSLSTAIMSTSTPAESVAVFAEVVASMSAINPPHATPTEAVTNAIFTVATAFLQQQEADAMAIVKRNTNSR